MTIKVTIQELMNKGVWETYCEHAGVNVWAVNEGLADSSNIVEITEEEAANLGLIRL